jgi:hypothetical protein
MIELKKRSFAQEQALVLASVLPVCVHLSKMPRCPHQAVLQTKLKLWLLSSVYHPFQARSRLCCCLLLLRQRFEKLPTDSLYPYHRAFDLSHQVPKAVNTLGR